MTVGMAKPRALIASFVRLGRLRAARKEVRSLSHLATSTSGREDFDGAPSSRGMGWGMMAAGFASALAVGVGFLQAEAAQDAGERKDNLPEFTREDVSKHDEVSKRVWVTYREGVYDITDLLPQHPGSQSIMMAAGASVEPFWEIYAFHKQSKIYQWLETFRIGNLKVEDVFERDVDSDDPFGNEPSRHPALKVVNQKPFNAETPLELISDSFFTPNDVFYVRNHLPTPHVDPGSYELEVSGIGGEEVTFQLADLKTKFRKHTVVCAVQCGGNRRAEMMAKKELKGLPWTGGAIGNARWSGVRLYDVLKSAGLTDDESVRHVQFEGCDVGPDGLPYGASIPVEKAFDPSGEVILAYEMNGEALPRDHGFPVRVVVPGVVGARHVKWLKRIVVSSDESDSHWQQNDYKGFNPGVTWDTLDYSKSPAIQNMPVTSLICKPADGSAAKVGKDSTVEIAGYAYSGSGNKIARIDLTADGGKTWFEGRIRKQDASREPRHYGWTLWSAAVPVPDGAKEVEIWSKAVDSSCNVQPETFENIWNVRGLLSNAYSRVKIRLER